VLDAFVRGALPWGTRLGVEGHIDTCTACSEVVSEMARLFASSQASASSVVFPEAGDTMTEEVGRYRLGRRLGSGAMGMVFEAHDPQLHRKVAIKLLHPHVADGPDGVRLLREARSMAQLAHPNVVAVHDAGRASTQVFVAMELVEGETLRGWLDHGRTRAEIMDAFVQAGRGLEAAHAVGIVHRDFKPDNVMVGHDGRARVTDFGLARPSVRWSPDEGGALQPDVCMTIDGLTGHGAVVGTPAYMSPEQWRGQVADARSDQFAFCVALYEALQGERPFEGRTLPMLSAAVTAGRRRAPPRGLPRWLREALDRGLEVDPAQRHASMSALLRQLERDRGGLRRTVVVVGAMGIGAAATVGVLRWMAEETLPPEDTLSVVAAIPDVAPVDPSADVEACKAQARAVEGSWNVPRREAFVARLERAEDGDTLRRLVLPRMERWATDYAAASAPLCDPASAPAQQALRARCLVAVRGSFDALLGASASLRPDALGHGIVGAAVGLPDPLVCAREPWLSAMPDAPAPEDRARVGVVATDVSSARALGRVGAYIEAMGVATAAVTEARALGHAPLLARALLVHGELALARHRVDVAAASLEEAVALAGDSGAVVVQGEAATLLLRIHGALLLDAAKLERWRRLTGGFAERLGDPALTAAVMVAEAEGLIARLELREARTLLDEALSVHTELFGERHPAVATVHRRLAEVALALDDPAQAQAHAQSAVRILEATVGAREPATSEALRVAAQVALHRAEPVEATALAKRAEDAMVLVSTAVHEVHRGRALLVQGDVLVSIEDFTAAEEAYEDAELYLRHGSWTAAVPLRLARLRLAQGDPGGAVEQARVALGGLEGDDTRRTPALRVLAQAQRAGGDLDGALKTLSEVADLVRTHVGYGPLQSRARIEMASVVREMDEPALALKLLDDAHVPWVGAYGLHHPRVVDLVLARADLAWELEQRDYARRLYGNLTDELQDQRGPEDPATVRARARSEKK
jgi:tetratricopeptide (TPR) repeat protein